MSPKLTKDILKSRAQFAQVVTDQYSKIFNKGLDTCSTCQETKEEGQRTVQSEARQRKKAANKAKQAALKISNDREVDGKSTPLVAYLF